MPIDPDELRAQAADLEATAKRYREMADEIERYIAKGLLKGKQVGTVNTMDAQAHAFATSQGRADDELVKAANKARLTLDELAKRVALTKSHLSQARRGTKRIRESAARKIEEITGFAATKTNWPKGLILGK